uniref:Putative glycosyl phosphatidyl inositol transamidase like protein n=1 Tax=Arachis duranensis TaxID=130453 RepID=N1NJR4_ARADU|nr:putative glycosyl phosphatidyl inositol transamidase like protein [Arachis duranensis]
MAEAKTHNNSNKPRPRILIYLAIQIITHSTIVSVICFIAGIVALLLLPVLAKNTYISENALMPGSATNMLSSHDVAEANKLVKDLTDLKLRSNGSPIESRKLIAQYMLGLDAEVTYHNFYPQLNQFHPLHFFTSPDSSIISKNISCASIGINTVGIIRAPRGDGKEAIVLVTPYNPKKVVLGEALSLGVAYSVFSLLSRVTWLAKDIIWLVADSQYGEYSSVSAWLREYQAPQFHRVVVNSETCNESSTIEGNLYSGFRRAGTIAAALVVKIAEDGNHFDDSLNIYAEASNGQMPNLDLINIVNYLAVHKQHLRIKVSKMWSLLGSKWLNTLGVFWECIGQYARRLNPQWKFGIPANEYVEGTATLASSMYYQGLGVPTGPHGAFRDYQVDAITVEISPKVSPTKMNRHIDFIFRGGRLIEGVVRSINNLLEKFHQSFFLYLLTSPSKFVSVGVYMIPFALLGAPLPIVAASLYMFSSKATPQAPVASEVDFSLESWKWINSAKKVFVIHLWGVAVSLLPYFLCRIPGLTPTNNLTVWGSFAVLSLVILFSMLGYPTSVAVPSEAEKREWANLKSVTLSAIFIGLSLMSVINFATAEIGALLIVPFCLMARPLMLDIQARSMRTLLLATCNLALGSAAIACESPARRRSLVSRSLNLLRVRCFLHLSGAFAEVARVVDERYLALLQFVACGEPHLTSTHIAFIRYLNRTIESIRRDIADTFAAIFGSENNLAPSVSTRCEDDIALSSTKYLISAIGKKCHLIAQDCSSNEKSFRDKKGPDAVFNVLDNILKDSLERLKMMRENISLAKIDLQGCTFVYNYTEHAATIRSLCLEGKLGAAMWLRRKMVQKGLILDVFTHNHIVNGLCRTGLAEEADWLIREMLEFGPHPNSATYNTLIKAYCIVNSVDKALYLFSTMTNTGIQPNRVTCNILVHALCEKGLLKEAKRMLEEILHDNHNDIPNLVTSTIFLDYYFKNGAIIQALSLWNEMLLKCTNVDVVAYNVLINGFCKNQQTSLAYGYACEMIKKGLQPDGFTYNILIHALCKEGKTGEACYILGVMSKMGVMPDQISYKIMIRGLCFVGNIAKAKELLSYMLSNAIITKPLMWNIIIDFYGRCRDRSNAFFTRDQMLAFGVCPNVFTYNSLILAEVKCGNFHDACTLKEEMIIKGLFPDIVTYNLLIGTACSLGRLGLALELHDEMVRRGCKPDIITYTELVRGFCIRGDLKEAEELCAKILKSGLLNDHVPVQILFSTYCKRKRLFEAFNLYQQWLVVLKWWLNTAALFSTPEDVPQTKDLHSSELSPQGTIVRTAASLHEGSTREGRGDRIRQRRGSSRQHAVGMVMWRASRRGSSLATRGGRGSLLATRGGRRSSLATRAGRVACESSRRCRCSRALPRSCSNTEWACWSLSACKGQLLHLGKQRTQLKLSIN